MSFRWDNYVLTTARTAGSAAVDTVIVSVIVIINNIIIIIIIIIIIVRKVTETRLTCYIFCNASLMTMKYVNMLDWC